MLFSTILSDTRGVAIGPLEYCGNGKVIKLPHGKTLYVLLFYPYMYLISILEFPLSDTIHLFHSSTPNEKSLALNEKVMGLVEMELQKHQCRMH